MAQYEPAAPPQDLEDVAALGQYLFDELQKLAAAFNEYGAGELPVSNAEPERPRDGMLRYADGTNWNPGAGGEGIYAYYNSTWNRLG